MNWKGILMFGILIIDTLILIMILNIIGFKNFGIYALSFIFSVMASTVALNLLRLVDMSSWEKKSITARWKAWRGTTLFIIVALSLLLSALIGGFFAGLVGGLCITLFLLYACQDFLHIINFYQESFDEDIQKWLDKKMSKTKKKIKKKIKNKAKKVIKNVIS